MIGPGSCSSAARTVSSRGRAATPRGARRFATFATRFPATRSWSSIHIWPPSSDSSRPASRATRSASAAGAAPGADAARRSLPSEAVEIQTAEIRYLRDRVLASHARLVVVAVPPRGAIYPADADADRLGAETMEHGLNTVCRAEHIPFFSGTRRIRELSDQSRERSYFTRDGHMTRA